MINVVQHAASGNVRTHQPFYPNKFPVYTFRSQLYERAHRDRAERCQASSHCGMINGSIRWQFISQIGLLEI